MLIEDESGVKEELEPTPGSDTHDTKAEGETTSPEDGAAPKGGDETPAGKTYTEEDVNRMMHERTKDYASMKRDLESYRAFGSAQEIQTKLTPKPAPAAPPAPAELAMDEDDKKFDAYMRKMYPGISKLGMLGKLDESRLGFIEALQRKDEAEKEKYVDGAQNEVFKFCDTINAKDEAQKVVVRDAIAAAILNDQALAERWDRRDPTVIADAIKVLETTLGKRTEVAGKQDLSSVKAKVEKIQAPLPKGGVPAPISKPKNLTEDERVEKAWGALNNKG